MKRILVTLLLPFLLLGCGDDAVELVVPTVSITFPTNGQSVSGIITLAAEVSGPVGIARVSYAVDGEELGSADAAPYELQWNTADWADGLTHTLVAEAEDFDGNLGFSEHVVVIVNP